MQSSSLLLYNTLNKTYWQLYFDIYGQTQDIKLLSQLSIENLRTHNEYIQQLQNRFDLFVREYFGQNMELITNDGLIRILVDLRQYLEKSRIIVELALNRCGQQSATIDVVESPQPTENNDSPLLDCCTETLSESKSEPKSLNALANPFNISSSTISKTIPCDDWQLQTTPGSCSQFSNQNAGDDNESVSSIANDKPSIDPITTVQSSINSKPNYRPKKPMEIFDENGQPVDLVLLSSSLTTGKKLNNSDDDIMNQLEELKVEKNSKNTDQKNFIDILLDDLNVSNIETKVSEFISQSFDDPTASDDIEKHLEQLYRFYDGINDNDTFENKLKFLNKLFEYNFVQVPFMLRMYDHLLQICIAYYQNQQSFSSKNDFIIDCFAEFFKRSRPLLVNKPDQSQNESNRIRFVYLKRLQQRLLDILQNYQQGFMKLSEKNVEIISMASEFIATNLSSNITNRKHK
uniref:Uncharacterized protein LOC113790659 n=1 Tax=Dermatophagoides pteronyssinus TaxID=6956 RepID=A0A6P6XRY4_DERPT|nr:uncharacterized protein LOC113790659 [Dermatophagoides pteronyssinus]